MPQTDQPNGQRQQQQKEIRKRPRKYLNLDCFKAKYNNNYNNTNNNKKTIFLIKLHSFLSHKIGQKFVSILSCCYSFWMKSMEGNWIFFVRFIWNEI